MEHGTEEDCIRDMQMQLQVQVKAEYMTDYTRQESSLSEVQTFFDDPYN
jgi:hypothetical protein